MINHQPVKSTLYLTTKVQPGHKIECQVPELAVGATVEIVILIPDVNIGNAGAVEENVTLEQRRAFLKLPMSERRRILAGQAAAMLVHYQQDSQWQELMTGDIIDY